MPVTRPSETAPVTRTPDRRHGGTTSNGRQRGPGRASPRPKQGDAGRLRAPAGRGSRCGSRNGSTAQSRTRTAARWCAPRATTRGGAACDARRAWLRAAGATVTAVLDDGRLKGRRRIQPRRLDVVSTQLARQCRTAGGRATGGLESAPDPPREVRAARRAGRRARTSNPASARCEAGGVRRPSWSEDRGVYRQHRPRRNPSVQVNRAGAHLAEHPVAFGGRRQLLKPLDQPLQPRESILRSEGEILHGDRHSTRLRRNAQSQQKSGPRCRTSRPRADG
jgi:hypothetical protein